MPDALKDPYQVLNLPPGSSDEEIRKQYRRLARIYHPDRNPGDAAWCEEQLTELNIAFDVLSNPARKAALDAKARAAGEAAFREQTRQTPAGAHDAGYSTATPGPRPDTASNRPVNPSSWNPDTAAPSARRSVRTIQRKRSGGAWIFLAVLTGVGGVVAWNKYKPVPPILSKVASPGNYEEIPPKASSTTATAHTASETSSRPHEHAKVHTAYSAPHHATRRASIPRHNTAVRIPRHFGSLTSSQKSSVALRLAEAAEARGRASLAPHLRHKGIDAHGLNYSQMRKLDSQ